MDGAKSGERKGPAHARGHNTLPKGNEDRLTELGKLLPPPGEDELEIIRGLRHERRRRRFVAWLVAIVLLALLAGAIAQYVRPLPASSLEIQGVHLPGTTPTFAWPSTGEAAAVVEGSGTLGQVRGSQPVPVAGLIDVLTAYVVLTDHPLQQGADGPSIPVTNDTLTAFQNGQNSHESEIPVAAGESLTEIQALEGLLIDNGADMATLLAVWDAGSTNAFVAKMSATAQKLGLSSTHITDPSGADPATTSTAEDLVRLGEKALSISILRQIVSLGQPSVLIPMTNVVYNLNFDLGRDGIIGIKTASDSNAQGCYLVAAQQNIGGKTVTVVGAVLGQPAGSLGPNTAAVDAGDALFKSIFGALHSYPVFTPGQTMGAVGAPWGATAPVTVSQPVNVVGWPGLSVTLVARRDIPKGALPKGASVGTLQAIVGTTSTHVQLHTAAPLSAPGLLWRLTR
jgi:serine-type D-Ala-D-Ala carboxypeptidase (penicillin-binding protein 5/6)